MLWKCNIMACCAFLPNLTFSVIILTIENQPYWKYFQHRNLEMLQIQGFLFGDLVC